MSASAARKAALETVTRVRERNAYAHETFDAVITAFALDQRDLGFAARLAYGTVATRGTLDEAVSRHVKDPSRLEPVVADALAVAAYELLFMRTPARAAVSQGVELVRSVRQSAAGLANAVLRRVSEDVETFPWGDTETDVAALARRYGHPLWIAEMLVEQHGHAAAEKVMAADNEPAPLFLAHLPSLGPIETPFEDLASAAAGPHLCELPGCVVVDDAAAARGSSAVKERRLLVMDAGAQFAARAALPAAGHRLVELGAGRGSKSLLMASIAATHSGPVDVVAVDLHGHKLESLRSAAKALAIEGISTVLADAVDGELGVAEGTADSVLVDAPCSGLGTLRRHPDRRWRATPDEIEALAALGAQMLQRAARLVRPGGFVVYSTCTVVRQENDDVVNGFLASEQGEGFSIDSLMNDVPAEWERFITPEGWFQSLPEPGGPDGHFVARLVRG